MKPGRFHPGRLARRLNRESGQSVVLLAISITAIIVMTTLIIDGANVFLNHRKMQNASDAGSRAATRALGLGANDSTIWHCAKAYSVGNAQCYSTTELAGNGAQTFTAEYVNSSGTSLGAVGSGTVPSGAKGVRVYANNTFDTLFASVLGRPTIDTQTKATNATGQIKTIRNATLYPLVVATNTVQMGLATGTTVLWDTQAAGSSAFGWLSLDGSTSTSSLDPYVANGFALSNSNPINACTTSSKTSCSKTYTSLTWPTWMQNWSGTSGSGLHNAVGQEGNRWTVFVYDYTNNLTGSNIEYHIVGIAEFQITRVVDTTSAKTIEGKFVRYVLGKGEADITSDCVTNGYGVCGMKAIE